MEAFVTATFFLVKEAILQSGDFTEFDTSRLFHMASPLWRMDPSHVLLATVCAAAVSTIVYVHRNQKIEKEVSIEYRSFFLASFSLWQQYRDARQGYKRCFCSGQLVSLLSKRNMCCTLAINRRRGSWQLCWLCFSIVFCLFVFMFSPVCHDVLTRPSQGSIRCCTSNLRVLEHEQLRKLCPDSPPDFELVLCPGDEGRSSARY